MLPSFPFIASFRPQQSSSHGCKTGTAPTVQDRRMAALLCLQWLWVCCSPLIASISPAIPLGGLQGPGGLQLCIRNQMSEFISVRSNRANMFQTVAGFRWWSCVRSFHSIGHPYYNTINFAPFTCSHIRDCMAFLRSSSSNVDLHNCLRFHP